MATLIAFPLLGFLTILQTTVVSQIPLLHGTADLLLLVILAWALQKRVKTAWHWCIIGALMVTLISALPFGITLMGYILATGLALSLRQRLWQVPVLAMFLLTLLGTLVTHAIDLVGLRLMGTIIPFTDALNLVTLPSALLNLLLAVPIFALIGDLANWMYPEEIEV